MHGLMTMTGGADDSHLASGGHGTPLTGLSLYGDLEPLMNGDQKVQLTHRVESMKLLPPIGRKRTDPDSYGVVTQGAVGKVESEGGLAQRSFCLATSSTVFPPSRPSSWSGALDQISSGSMLVEALEDVKAFERSKRLVLVATGNAVGGRLEEILPLKPLEDPSQSWNALTIGGFTRKDLVPEQPNGLKPAVPANHRSPYSKGTLSLPSDLTPNKARSVV